MQIDGPPPAEKFGTFLGVFTPSVLTILGLIMYLRFGWVVGNVGLPGALLIVLLASAITYITSLSASAVATNMTVGVGGPYYLISRSLGLELGGAIGIPLFFCRTLSITFYSFGLAESILNFWPTALPPHALEMSTAVIILLITSVSGKSAGIALKLQLPIMALVGLSIVALALGVFGAPLQTPEWEPAYRTTDGGGFWYVFAVFFPAVTGWAVGIGMSGDLKDPRYAIPKGTIWAVITGTIIYLLIPVLLAITSKVTPEQLAEPRIIWLDIAVLGTWLVLPGLWGAILSSAFGSVLGGPRVLQALANDGLAPKFTARVSKTGQPTIATWISGAIAVAAVGLGSLEMVAELVTMLFLTLYVVVNLSAAIEKMVGDPSYRPTINVPAWLSILGAVATVCVMFLISPAACIAAVTLELMLYLFLRRRALQQSWGDVRGGMWLTIVRFALLMLRRHGDDPRNWRPHILLFAGNLAKRIGLVRLANWFNQDRGVVTVCQLLNGDLTREKPDVVRMREEMQDALTEAGQVAFAEVDVVSDWESGAIQVTQANGIAGLQSNTVLFGWSAKPERLIVQLRVMRAVAHVGKSTIIARLKWAYEPGQKKRIDVWWRGKESNGDMMLLLAHMLTLNQEWHDAQILVRSIVSADEREAMSRSLAELIPEVRIEAETEVLLKPADKTVMQFMHEKSRDADIVFLGLAEPDIGAEEAYAEGLTRMVEGFNTTILVRNAHEFAGELI